MQNDSPIQNDHEWHRLVHKLRNAINAIVTSGKVLERIDGLPAAGQPFLDAITQNSKEAGHLMERLEERWGDLRTESPPDPGMCQ